MKLTPILDNEAKKPHSGRKFHALRLNGKNCAVADVRTDRHTAGAPGPAESRLRPVASRPERTAA